MPICKNQFRKNIAVKKIKESTGLANKQKHARLLVKAEAVKSGEVKVLDVIDRSKRKSDKKRSTRHQNVSKQKPKTGGPQRKDFKCPELFDDVGAEHGRSYASKAGERLEAKQAGFDDVLRHPITIGCAIHPEGTNMAEATNMAKKRLRKVFGQLSEGRQVSGFFQVAIKPASYLADMFPYDECPESLDPYENPNELFYFLHFHGIIAEPHMTRNEVRNIVADAHPGKKCVCLRIVQPERMNKDGEITHGAQGYFEYAALDKTEIDTDADSDQMAKEALMYAKASVTWSKRNRSFSFGKPLSQTGIKIDPDRMNKLKHIYWLQRMKSKFNELSYAEQFLYSWVAGSFCRTSKESSWVAWLGTGRDYFLRTLTLVRNWSLNRDIKDIDFFTFADGCPEKLRI